MQRRVATANLKRSSNKMLPSALIGLALTLSATVAYAQNTPKPAAVSKPHSARRAVVSIPDRKLALMEENRVVKVYDVAVGAPASPSPSGEFQITERLENPTYYSPGVVIEPGAGNPLGTRWMGLNIKGFGIHGTNSPDSIGHNASHGCIRLRNREVEELFVRLKVGDRVSLIAERSDEVAQIFGTAPGFSKTQTQAARNEARFPSAEEPGGDR
jgi:lipoprotein-anchoring transpeptidase ErfK/SrfK